jgi:hypothetical protein
MGVTARIEIPIRNLIPQSVPVVSRQAQKIDVRAETQVWTESEKNPTGKGVK